MLRWQHLRAARVDEDYGTQKSVASEQCLLIPSLRGLDVEILKSFATRPVKLKVAS